jgi:hypothetical protein
MPTQPQIPWDYYASLRRQQATTPPTSDPVAATLSAMNADTAHEAVLNGGDPAQIGRANQLGRQVGEHPSMIEDGLDDVQRGLNAQGMAGMAQANPFIGQHLAQNPRTAAAAAGDHQWLNVLGQSWDHLTNTLPGVIDDIFAGTNNSGANGGTSALGASGLIARPLMAGMAALMGNTAAVPALQREAAPVGQGLRGALFSGVANLYSGAAGYARMLTDGIGWDSASQLLDQQRRNANDYAMHTMPHTGEWVPDQILGGVSNVPSTGLALSVGLGARGAGLGLKAASALGALSGGVVQGGQSYNKGRDEGLTWVQAATYANIDAATETAGEYVGELQFLKATAGGSSLMTRFLRSQIGEVAGEEFSTVAQDFSAWAILPENKNKPISDFFSKLPEDMASTAVQTLVAGGISNLTIGGIEHALNTGAAQLRRRVAAEGPDIVRADLAQPVIETMAQAAQNSQLRARDPDGYNDMVRDLGEQHGATHVFVPGEAVQSYLQSDGFDPFTDPMSQWADHAREAAATGGDVVLPVEFALGTLPGTPAFAALKDDMRLDAGGLSQREADELKARYPKAMETMAERATGADQGQQASNAAVQRIVDRVTAQLEQNGFTPAAASAQAQLIAMREATRAARLGRDLTGNEFETEVREIGSPPAPEARQADVNDLVIHAMRKGAPATTQGGKSLLEFIADRGGINDDGGDLRSMGIEAWHRARPGRRRLVRDPELGINLGAPSGRGDYGVDSTLRAAIEAGYFPELANVENEHGPSTLDTNHLMDAIGDELAGSPRYAEAPTTDHIRQWADDLRQMLESQGHDPASMTDEQIREAIGKLEPGSDAGLNYEDLPEGAARALEQGEFSGPRGRIVFTDGKPVIELFQARNLSTLLHELGHQWLEELRADATHADAPQQLQDDWHAVERWFADNGHAIGDDGVIPIDAHELWARGTERYLMEGRAPSSALSRLFETFRGWMLAIYRKVDSLRAPITPEIRQVMDRMLATDDEITAAQDRLQLEPLFRDAAAAGMTGPEFAAYADQVQRAREEAGGQLMAKTMADIRRSKQAAYQREWREERDKQAEKLDRSPLLSAIRLAKENGISKSWMADRLGQDAVDLLPRMVPPLAREKGMNADDLAEQAGFASGQQMIETLIGAERAHKEAVAGGDKRGLRQRLIDTATDAAMEVRHGTDPFSNGEIEREAQAAVNNQLQGEVLAAEARALARRTGQDVTPYSLARRWARGRVRGGIVAEEASAGAIARHARNVAKAGRAAEAALVKGDMGAALVAKQQQLISSALLAEAKEAHDQVEAAKDRLAKIARRKTMKSVDQAYLEQAQTLLAEVNFVEATQKLLDRQNKWAEWAQARQAEGYDVVVPASFEATIKGTHWSRLSVENLMGLDEAVAQVMHLGRLKQSLLDGQEERDWADIEAEAIHAASHLRQRPPAPLIEPGLGDRIKSGILSIDATLLRMETVFDWLDGGDPNGVFNRIAFRPVADAQAREDAMLSDYYHRTRDLFDAVPREDLGRWQDKVVLPFQYRVTGAPVELRRHQIIAMALNVGNEGNLQRLADGYGWNRGAIMEFLNGTLTKGEWTYVQGVWDTIETLWPQIEAMEKRINGVAPDKVEPLKFLTPHGEMQGGYYPAIYDETRDYKAEENRGRDADLFEGRYTRANTTASATKAREEVVKKPILLDMGVINRHLGEVIHDITHREAVMKAWRFLTSERVMQAVDEALGPEVRKQFRPWVKFIANRWASERAGNEGFGKFIQALRANTTAVGLGLRASTILVHTSGLVYGTEVIGEKWMAQGMAAMAKDYRGTVNHVLEQSPEVRAHLEHFDNDIRKQIDKLNDGRPLTKAAAHIREAQRFLFHGIGFMVQRVSVPVWVGAYNKGISEGLSDADAKFAADKAVRKTMGSAGAKDLAAIQRGTGKWGEVAKLFTMFYTQMSAQYQRQRTLYRDATGQDVRQPRSLGRLAARAWWLIAIAPMWDAAIKMALGGHGPDDDEWWATFVFKHMLANQLAPIPGLRDLFQPTWNAVAGHKVFNPSVTPLQKVYDSVINLGKDLGNVAHGKPTKQLTRHALESVGYATGLVPGQFASATQFLVDLSNGQAHPHSVSDWVQGLSTGRIKEH